MPYKVCKCGNHCGVRTLTCSKCQYQFSTAKTKGYGSTSTVRGKLDSLKQPTGMFFRRIPLDTLTKKAYDESTTKLYSDASGKYLIRVAYKLRGDTPIAHDKYYAALVREMVTQAFSNTTKEILELIGFYNNLYTADIACKKHKDGELLPYYKRVERRIAEKMKKK